MGFVGLTLTLAVYLRVFRLYNKNGFIWGFEPGTPNTPMLKSVFIAEYMYLQ